MQNLFLVKIAWAAQADQEYDDGDFSRKEGILNKWG